MNTKKTTWEIGNPFPNGCTPLHNFPPQPLQVPIHNVPGAPSTFREYDLTVISNKTFTPVEER